MSLPFSAATKNIFGMVQNGTAFDTSILGNIGGMADRMTTAATTLSTSGLPEIGNNLANMVTGPMTNLLGHVTNQIADLPKNLGVANSFLGMSKNLGVSAANDGSSGECSGMGDFFGSIMGGATSVLNTINGVMTTVETAIGAVVGTVGAVAGAVMQTINAAMTTLQNTMTQITTMIQGEIAKMTAAVQQLGHMAGALVLSTLFGSSPCMKQLVSSVGSTGLLSNLTG